MSKLFGFDVTLKDLMNLGGRAKDVTKLDLIFKFLNGFWYSQADEKNNSERWNNVRIGSIDVSLNEQKNLCIDFTTRFQFQNSPEILEFLEKFKDEWKKDE